MERLTQWYDDGKIHGVLVKEGYEENALQTIVTLTDECYAAVTQLKVYEDTGLTPEQIYSIATELKEYRQIGLSPKGLGEHVAFCKRYRELFGATDFNRLMKLKERDTAKAHAEVSEEHGYFECPSCGELIYTTDDLKSHKFCLNCGRRLKFKED